MTALRHVLAVLGIGFIAQNSYRFLVVVEGWTPASTSGAVLIFFLLSVLLYGAICAEERANLV
jgi:hypothetical protein